MEFEKRPSEFDKKWSEILTASENEEYDHVDNVLVPELAGEIKSDQEVRFLFDRMGIDTEPDWVVRDAAVATLNAQSIVDKIREFGLEEDTRKTMINALYKDDFPWIPANAMNWFLTYGNLDDQGRKIFTDAFKNRSSAMSCSENKYASRWTRPVLQSEVSFLSDIPEIAQWLG